MATISKRLREERDRHVAGYPGPRRDVAGLLDEAADTIDALVASLRDQFCPRPCNGRPDQFDVGECGCSANIALALTNPKEPSNGDD